MIITTIEELRLCFPSHAIDSIDAFVGYIDNSEHEFLLQPLGQPLYDKLCEWYDQNKPVMTTVIDKNTGYYNHLAIIAQRCVAFDAMSRAIDQQAISINGSGINFASAEDYKTADRDSINAAKQSYQKEAHAALNRLLYTLEQWNSECPTEEDATADTKELYEICKFWRSSRYFYLAAQLLIARFGHRILHGAGGGLLLRLVRFLLRGPGRDGGLRPGGGFLLFHQRRGNHAGQHTHRQQTGYQLFDSHDTSSCLTIYY
jgi:hypothetical protein